MLFQRGSQQFVHAAYGTTEIGVALEHTMMTLNAVFILHTHLLTPHTPMYSRMHSNVIVYTAQHENAPVSAVHPCTKVHHVCQPLACCTPTHTLCMLASNYTRT